MVLKAASDRTRIRIIKLLQNADELCVCEIISALDMRQAAVSRALSVLRNAGIVNAERKGLWMYYSLNLNGKPDFFTGLSSLLKKRLNNDPVIKKDRAKLKDALKHNNKKAC